QREPWLGRSRFWRGHMNLQRSRTVVGLVAFLACLLTRPSDGEEVGGQPSPQPERQPIPSLVQPATDIQAVLRRHCDEFLQIPAAYAVMPGIERLTIWAVVYTDAQGNKPATLPVALLSMPPTVDGTAVEVHPVYRLPPPPGV